MVPKQLNLIRTHVTQFNNFENNLVGLTQNP